MNTTLSDFKKPSVIYRDPTHLVDIAIANLNNPSLVRSEALQDALTLLRTLANLPKREHDYIRLWRELYKTNPTPKTHHKSVGWRGEDHKK